MTVNVGMRGGIVAVHHRSLHTAPLRLGQGVQELKDAKVR
jgi:hypothetical protein